MGPRLKDDPFNDTRHKPTSPPGCGPAFEWYQESRRGFMYAVLGGMLLVALVGTLRTGGIAWVTDWVAWVVVVCVVIFGVLVRGVPRFSAGADWFSHRKSWVNTYDLVRVEIIVTGPNYQLALKDLAGRLVHVKIDELQLNPRLWDLVYNGILHSAHSREIEANQKAIDWLRLPPHPPPTLAERQARDPSRPLPRRRAFRRFQNDR